MSEIWTNDNVTLCSPTVEHPCCTGGASVLLSDARAMMLYSGPVNPHNQEPGTVRMYASVSPDHGETWGQEREIIHHPECQAGGGSILRARDGTLWIIYMGFYASVWREGEPDMDATRSDLWRCYSKDDGRTWVGRQMIWKGYTGATNGLIETTSGHILMPFSYVIPHPGRLVSACLVSGDGGETWQLGSHIDLGGHGDHAGALEPAVIQLTDGRVWMLIRTTKGCFWQAFSNDNGMTWSEAAPTPIASPSAPCHITRLQSGRIALAWNNTMRTTKARDTLSLALSDDDGKSWTKPMECARAEQVSYPFILEVRPGLLMVGCNHVQAGWKRVSPVMFRVSEQALLSH